jgi:uncharacterized protein YbaR (Trm112 family)
MMVMEKKLTISLDEIKTIRVVCKVADCGGVIEMPANRLEALTGMLVCPSCARNFPLRQLIALGGSNPLRALGVALRELSCDPEFSVEVVLPAPGV